MIPSVIASQIRYGLEDYLRATFPVETPFFQGMFDRFFAQENQLFRGPFLNLKLPFRLGERLTDDLYPELPMKFTPYLHQEKAYQRLSAEEPKSTLIATGTGSGKTECFMYPLLHYCWTHQAERGIKAIVIYPMNALATDQMKRFASEIYNNQKLKGNVTVGLFIGGQKDDSDGCQSMRLDSVITCRNAMLANPPDILMTNYKMLDYLLLRPKDYKLWRLNTPDMLKYIVVDELHTFDGAQGTDLACLLRRLLHRLRTPAEQICFTGTSATLGNGKDSAANLLHFAEKLFGTHFDEEAVISEDVLRPYEFLGDTLGKIYPIPSPSDLNALLFTTYHQADDYLHAQLKLWFGEDISFHDLDSNETRLALGNHLIEHHFFQNLIKLLGNDTAEEEDLTAKLERILPGFSQNNLKFRQAFFDSLYALISLARREITRSDGQKVIVPFLNVRVQLWMREMRRMVATVETNPSLGYGFDKSLEDTVCSLPLVHCRECGKMGYVSILHPSDSMLISSPNEIYQSFFNHRPSTCFIFPLTEKPKDKLPGTITYLCGHCLHIGEDSRQCAACGKSDKLILVELKTPHNKDSQGRLYVDNDCPYCNTENSLTIVGARSASLTSVVIGQLFASRYNDETPKLLAFSDSVQDASHRAGFFTARTYRFNLRAAIQQIVKEASEPLTLPQLSEKFQHEWQQRLGSEIAMIAQFIPADLIDWEMDYLSKHGNLPADSRLPKKVKARLHWEIWSEYGYNSRIGRTLEKTSCSVAGISASMLQVWSDAVLPKLHNDLGFRNCTELQVKRILAFFVRFLCIKGGIYADYLEEYMKDGNTFGLNKKYPFLPNFYHKRAPVFVGFDNIPKRFENLNSDKYKEYLTKLFGNLKGLQREILELILDEGVKLDILKTVSEGNCRIWGLNPEKLLITRDVVITACEKTGHLISAPAWEKDLWEGMPSNQTGEDDPTVFRINPNAASAYYADLYNYGKIQRIIAKEHTGLLERQDREELEQNFIRGDSIVSPNILSCTPTLEMGINIGDLSTVILCSIPPAQANYIQRIGRAGRQDGNAFNFVVATGNKYHDMHFFAEPQEMLNGDVTPPGIFLQAPAVLERQLTAFCLDSWVEEIKGDTNAIPPQLSKVLDAVANQDDKKFPFTFFRYVSLNRISLLTEFFELFPTVFTSEEPQLRQSMQEFMENKKEGGLEGRILFRLQLLEQKRIGFRKKLKDVNERLKKLQSKPSDKQTELEIKELSNEKHALISTLNELNDKLTFNFFTDEGLLPNYAFPEAGVTLRSIIYRRNPTGGESKIETKEYERSGRAAISEFAPGNVFYVDGRKLTINSLVLTDNDIEKWHFCGVCNHIEKVTDDHHVAACPKCGSPTWGDGNMIRNVLRMREVVANEDDVTSRSYDEGDDREPVFFNKYMMTEFQPEYIENAYKADVKDFPFGFEYHRKAQFREINFGKYDDVDDISIARRKVSRQGFRICPDCGVVALNNGKPFRHKSSCRYHGRSDEHGTMECLYLFREFESEAIRVLLPIDETDSKMNSFIAALYMGLKARFEGGVDHIQIMHHYEPIPDSTLMKTYLVLFDQIPGGTGYLKQLTSSADEFMTLLETTLQKLNGCRCQHEPDKGDGCYSCLYAYRVSYDLPNIKSSYARSVLESLVAHKDKIIKTNGIDSISVNPILESALEKQFIEGLQKSKWNGHPIELEKRIISGKLGYVMKIGPNIYGIEPQVHLGKSEGILVDSKPDFLIYPLHRNIQHTKPVAIFTDGFQFHAAINTPDCYNFPSDLSKRLAIVKSGKYIVWSLTYNDVMELFEQENEYPRLTHKVPDNYDPGHFLKQGSFNQLIQYLAEPNDDKVRKLAFFVASTGVSPFMASAEEVQRYLHEIKTLDKSPALPSKASSGSICISKTVSNEATDFSFFISIPLDSFQKRDFAVAELAMRFSDNQKEYPVEPFRKMWNSFLSTFNIMQFLPGMIAVTDRFIKAGLSIPEPYISQADVPSEWQDLLQSVADNKALHDLAISFSQKHFRLPICSYEREVDGEITGEMAEFAWPEQKIAIVSTDDDQKAFSQDGWTVFLMDDDNLCDKLINTMREQ